MKRKWRQRGNTPMDNVIGFYEEFIIKNLETTEERKVARGIMSRLRSEGKKEEEQAIKWAFDSGKKLGANPTANGWLKINGVKRGCHYYNKAYKEIK